VDELIARAREYAVAGHARINQLRKYSQQPYDVHLREVARLVASVGGDSATVAAAWLHDIVEDTPATFEDVEREFGGEVMALVKELTDVSKPGDGNRAARKALDRQHLARGSARAKTIKLADILDNADDICRHDLKFGRVYLAEARSLLEVLREGDPALYALADEKLRECARKVAAVG
jgi:(p)ppGpp synthase/HD superfamily hydrolase